MCLHKILTSNSFDELTVNFIGEILKEKILIGETLMNHWVFVKFIKHQAFVLYNKCEFS